MTGMLFDTEKMVEHLEDSGVPAVQARAHVAVLLEVTAAMETAMIERCASKQDISELKELMLALKASFESRFAQVDLQFAKVDVQFAKVETRFAEVDTRMAKQETRLVRWVVAVGMLQTALIGALVLKLASATGTLTG